MTTKEIFEQLLPIYERALSEKWDYKKLRDNCLPAGICYAAVHLCNTHEALYFFTKLIGEYNYLCWTPQQIFQWENNSDFTPALQPRIDFMKNYIQNN